MNLERLLFVCLFINGYVIAWLDFTNTLPEEINITLYFENNTFKSFTLAPNIIKQTIYAFEDETSNKELPVRQIIAWSNKMVVIDWDNHRAVDENEDSRYLGMPIYGYKDTGLINLNKYLRSPRVYKSNLVPMKKYNGMIFDSRTSSQGFDTAKNPLEIVVIEQENIHDRDAIINLLPLYYPQVIPAGIEIGGTSLMVLAKKINK